MTRIANIDAVKITGLIALYVGHSTLLTAYPQINGLLQLYLDTAFMFLAGFFCMKSLENREYKFSSFWKNKTKTFLVPFWIIIILWIFTQRMPLRPATAYIAYGLGLRAFALPSELDLFSLWFASCLLGYFLIFSLLGKHKKITLLTTIIIIVCGYTILKPLMYWNWTFYLMPFAVGFFWKLKFNDKKALLLVPLMLLVFLPNTFTSDLSSLLIGLGLAVTSLFLFSKLKLGVKTNKIVTYVSSGTLITYLMEPIWGMWTGLLLFPQYSGGILENASVQFAMTPLQSATRLMFAIPLAFIVCPLIYKAIQKILKFFGRRRRE